MSTFRCRIVTPADSVLDEPATYATFQAHDGQRGVMRGASAFLTKLGVGVCRIETSQGAQAYAIDGGFAQMQGDTLVLLADSAVSSGAVDAATAERELTTANERARETPAQPSTQQQRLDIERAQARARARVAISRR
jgi:F-type H+-transporting ATPase subunit epsilon